MKHELIKLRTGQPEQENAHVDWELCGRQCTQNRNEDGGTVLVLSRSLLDTVVSCAPQNLPCRRTNQGSNSGDTAIAAWFSWSEFMSSLYYSFWTNSWEGSRPEREAFNRAKLVFSINQNVLSVNNANPSPYSVAETILSTNLSSL